VGDLVRVRLPFERDCDECPHFDEEATLVGRVVCDTPTAGAPSHPYLVIYEAPCACSPRDGRAFRLPGRHYAHDELEPI